jgi:flagellar motor switch protein FliG
MTIDVKRAAVVLMSLPAEDAALVMSQLSAKQIETVAVEIARLEHVSPDEQDEAIAHFAQANPGNAGAVAGGLSKATELIQKALGDRAAECINSVRRRVEAAPFAFLQRVDSAELLAFLSDEHPQTIALIVSNLPDPLAAEVISGLPAELRQSVVLRIAQMSQANVEALAEVEEGMKNRMSSVPRPHFQRMGGARRVAEILKVAGSGMEQALMETLGESDPELAEEIRRLMRQSLANSP